MKSVVIFFQDYLINVRLINVLSLLINLMHPCWEKY